MTHVMFTYWRPEQLTQFRQGSAERVPSAEPSRTTAGRASSPNPRIGLALAILQTSVSLFVSS